MDGSNVLQKDKPNSINGTDCRVYIRSGIIPKLDDLKEDV